MSNRFLSTLSFALLALPLTACGSGDDDAAPAKATWAGHTYYLDIASANWATPHGIGADLFGVAPAFIFKVEASGADTTVTLATAAGSRLNNDDPPASELIPVEEAKQDLCGPTQKLTLTGTYPKMEIAPDLLRMFVLNSGAMPTPVQTTADVFGFKLDDVLPNGSKPSTTGTLAATMDFSELFVLFSQLGSGRSVTSVCKAVRDQYTSTACLDSGDPSCIVECKPCPDDASRATCLSVTAEKLGAVEAPNLDVVEVDEASRPASCDSTVLPTQ